jgi:hypothetical protein
MTTRSKLLIFGIPAAVGLAALVRFLLQPDPQLVVHRAQNNLLKAKTFRYEVDLEFRGASAERRKASQNATAPGASPERARESKDLQTVEISAKTRTDLDARNPVRPASITAFSIQSSADGVASELSGESRKKDGRHYLKLAKTSGAYKEAAGPLIGVWVRSPEPFLELLLPLERKTDERPFDEKGVKEFLDAIALAPILRVAKELKEERAGDEMLRRYQVTLYPEVATALLVKLGELKTGKPADSDDLAKAAAEVAAWGQPVGEVWIGKKDDRIRRLSFETRIASAAGNGDIRATILFSRYGATVDVIAPEAQDLKDLLATFSEKHLSLAGARQVETGGGEVAAEEEKKESLPPPPAKRDGDADGLEDTQEFFYGSDSWNPDTDGDGWTDGYEVGHAINPVGPGPLFSFGL